MAGKSKWPEIDFRKIRAHGSPGSRADAFEELASLLLRDSIIEWPEGSTVAKFGNPDGGREGRGELQNGDVWAWQVKYLFVFGSAERRQIKASFTRALSREPNLARYYVVMPYDLPAGDHSSRTGEQKSAHTHWQEMIAGWEKECAASGRTVEFKYIGAHELVEALTKERNSGRLRYWFDERALSADYFEEQLEYSLARAGKRYSPELHVDVQPSALFGGLGRTKQFERDAQLALAAIRRVGPIRTYLEDEELTQAVAGLREPLQAVDEKLAAFLKALRENEPLPSTKDDLSEVRTGLSDLRRLLRSGHLRDGKYYVGDAASVHATVGEIAESIEHAYSVTMGAAARAANAGLVLLSGRAGVGKTHLLCDVAARRIADGLPTVLLHGGDFDSTNLRVQLPQLAGFEGTLEDFVAVLAAAGEAADRPALLIIDALNESESPQRWGAELRAIARIVARTRHVVFAASCRTEYLDVVQPGTADYLTYQHSGFGDSTREAVERYVREYRLPPIRLPILNPEFGNPLFLRLACEALSTPGADNFELGFAGLTTVTHAYLSAVDERLSKPTRCDYDPTLQLVRRAVSTIANLGDEPYGREDVTAITEALLPGRRFSQGLLHGLLTEGVLVDVVGNRIAFGYQRLGDLIRADAIADTEDAVRGWYESRDTREIDGRGVLGAIALIVPERFGVEIIDCLKDEDGHVDAGVVDAFVESVGLRAPEHTTTRTQEIAARLLDGSPYADDVWAAAIQVALTPDHALNAEWLNSILAELAIAERDLRWSQWLVGRGDPEWGPEVSELLRWGWDGAASPPLEPALDDSAAFRACLALSWMTSTPDMQVRDSATKALASLGERSPRALAMAAEHLRNCNDPYVVERVAAAMCAVALRTGDAAVHVEIADAAGVLVEGGWPSHLLTRDYLRRIGEVAREGGWQGPDWSPPYVSSWPPAVVSPDELSQLEADEDRKYGSLLFSLHARHGDFGRYEIGSAVRKFEAEDLEGLVDVASRAVLHRVLELGWTPERFGAIDKGRFRGPENRVERFGKKYQWIGFYEILGRLADNMSIREDWEPQYKRYARPEQLIFRDFDPTVLVRGSVAENDAVTHQWVSPVRAQFPDVPVDEYPQDLSGVPDPIELIALRSPEGTPWLTLLRHASWEQQLPPEVEALGPPRQEAWMQLRSYLVPIDATETLKAWASGQDWDGRWMPENLELSSCLLGAHPWAPEWADAEEDEDLSDRDKVPPPCAVRQLVCAYGGTGGSRASASGPEPWGYAPTQLAFRLLSLQDGRDFKWCDARGDLAAADLTVGDAKGSAFIVRRDLMSKLAEEGLTVFWTVLINKQRRYDEFQRSPDELTWVSASASYLWEDGRVRRVGAIASRRSPRGGPQPQQVHWSPGSE